MLTGKSLNILSSIDEYKEAKEFWNNNLSRELERIQLPTDFVRGSLYKKEKYTLIIDEEVQKKLISISRNQDISIYTVLLSVLFTELFKYTSQDDIIIGSPKYQKSNIEEQNNSGSKLLFRSSIEGELTFKELLFQVSNGVKEVYKNQYYRLEEAFRLLNIKDSLAQVTPINLIMENIHSRDSIDSIIESEYNEITLLINRKDDRIFFETVYNGSLFSEAYISRFCEHFKSILNTVLKNINIKLHEIDIMTEEDRCKLLCEFINTEFRYDSDKTIHKLFEEQVERTPEQTAVIFGNKKLTYRELNNKSNQLARIIRNKEVKADSIVALMIPRSIEMIVSIIAVLKSGAAYLPIDIDYPKNRINYMINESKACLLLSEENLVNDIEFNGETIFIGNCNFHNENCANLDSINTSDDLAYVIYTSGTTNMPKGVMIEHKSLHNFIISMKENYDSKFDEKDRCLSLTNYVFDVSVCEIFTPLLNGSSLVLYSEKNYDIHKLCEAISEDGITFTYIPPVLLNDLADELKKVKDKLKLNKMLVGVEAIKDTTLDKFLKINPQIEIVNGYGPTESSICATMFRFRNYESRSKSVPIGKPLKNTKIYIVDNNLNPQPIGIVGELCVSGEGVARGYLNRADLTQEKFVTNPFDKQSKIYKTGDLVRWLPSGNIEFIGRKDTQVKIRGYRIELSEIEHRLTNLDYVKQVAVIDRKDKNDNKFLCAYIVSEKKIIKNEIRSYLSKELPNYMIPSYFVQLDKMPLTPSGKVDKRTLIDLSDYINTESDYQAPENKIQDILVDVWKNILHTDKVGIDDDFFDLGAHSLSCITLSTKVKEEFNIDLPVTIIFERPTVRQLSQYIENSKKINWLKIEKLGDREFYPVSSVQKRLFLIQDTNRENINYNLPLVFEIKGNLDVAKLENSFKKMISRHDSFRTSFETINGEIVQKISDHVEFKLNYKELHNSRTHTIKKEIEECIRPFDLSSLPLIRANLLNINKDSYILIIDMHHIISDGTSVGIFVREIFELYRGIELKPLKIQYKDFVIWQQGNTNSERFKEMENYWIAIFNDEIPLLNLPYDYTRPKIQSFNGDLIRFTLDKELTEDLKRLVLKTDTTLYMVLLAVFNVLLSKYSGQDDIIVGTPIAGRTHSDTDNIIGMFANTLAIRNYPIGSKTFLEFLNEVKNSALGAYENQDYQFEDLLAKINVKKNSGRNPVFDVMFAMQNFYVPEVKSEEFEIKPYELKNTSSKFDLFLAAQDMGNDISFELQYCTDLFKRETINKFISNFSNLTKCIVGEFNTKIKNIEMITPEEKEKIIVDFNDTYSEYEISKIICEHIEERAILNPNKIALEFKQKKLSYGELNEKANMLATYLINETHVKENSLIGLLSERSDNIFVSMLGILKTGAAYVPIDPKFPYDRIKTILKDSNIEIVVSTKKQIDMISKLQWECSKFHTFICIDTDDLEHITPITNNKLMDKSLWEFIGDTAEDEIYGGGWISSYTGEKFTEIEMEEYKQNTLDKIKPYLRSNRSVLEIGCASGISMFAIAPYVETYFGTDLSKTIIDKNRSRVINEGINNIELECLQAHEIDAITNRRFDIIIINSVIQYFPSHNYLRDVLKKCITLLNDEGVIYFGDVMDLDLKDEMIESLIRFKNDNPLYKYITKTDFSSELFISKDFLLDLQSDFCEIANVNISNKIHTIQNELTCYRFDCIFEVNKNKLNNVMRIKKKYQHDINMLNKYKGICFDYKPNHTNIAYVIYTSGSTGNPKGVLIHNKAISNLLKGITEKIDFNEKKRILSVTNISFDIFVLESLLPLAKGMTIVIADEEEQRDPILLSNLIINKDINMLQTTPSRIQMILNYDDGLNALKKLNDLILGGETFTEVIYQKLQELNNTKIYNVYGPSETTVWSTLKELNERNVINIGRPISNTQVYILGRNYEVLPIGVAGELYISGDGLASGYLNNNILTNEKFIESPFISGSKLYKTGDIARWTIDGEIQFLGREDNQIKIRGYRIELEEIENKLLAHESVREVVVVCNKNSYNTFLSTFVVLNEKINTDILREYLSDKLPDYMIPAYFIEIDKIPTNSNGKIDRVMLMRKAQNIILEKSIIKPTTELETRLCNLWRETLHLDNIGIDDNFFELGGHSLNATNIIIKLHKEFNIDLMLNDIFKYPTIEKLSKHIESSEKGSYAPINNIENKEYYILSSAQKRIYMVNQMQPESLSYNMPTAMIIYGKVSIDRLNNAFKQIIQRQESFRTSFEVVDGEYIQKINNSIDFQINYKKDQNDSIDNLIKEFIKPFDLSKAPLLRAELINIGDEKFLLLCDMHHIISDGSSLNIFIKELLDLYNEKQLPEMRTRYRDYVYWQNEFKNTENFQKQKSYWIDKFSGEIPELNMPTDFPRTAVENIKGESISIRIAEELTKQIKELAGETETTIFMVLLTAYKILLSKCSGQQDIIVGCPIAERTHTDLDGIIGMFVNTLVMRSVVSDNISLKDFLLLIRKNTLEAYENQNYQFDDLISNLQFKRKVGRNPLFDILFTMQNMDMEEIIVENLKIQPYVFRNETAKFDLSLTVKEEEKDILIDLSYRSDLYQKKSMIDFLDHYTEILKQMVNSPNKKITDIEFEYEFKYVESYSEEEVEFSF